MISKITFLLMSAFSIATLLQLQGCAKMPSHDGSFNARYGIKNNSPEPKPAAQLIAEKPVEEEYKPLIQTLADPASVQSAPIDTIEPVNSAAKVTAPAAVSSHSETSKTPDDSTTDSTDIYPAKRSHHHTLGAGETLYSISSKFTGTSANWKQIADYNGIASPDAMTVGMDILIPLHLVEPQFDNTDQTPTYALVSPSQSSLDVSAQSIDLDQPQARTVIDLVNQQQGPESIEMQTVQSLSEEIDYSISTEITSTEDDTSSLQTGTLTQDRFEPEFQQPVVQESLENTEEHLNFRDRLAKLTKQIKSRIQQSSTAVVAATKAGIATSLESANQAAYTEVPEPKAAPAMTSVKSEVPAETWVKIEGNYTPKAVYKSAGYESGLLMRVSPGTTLKLTRQTPDWYEVETSKGSGFVFHRDALIVQ